MKGNEEIKALLPIVCPHCTKPLVVELVTSANLLDKESTEEVLKAVTEKTPDEPEEA
jgi:hypothetical protein